MQGAIGAQKSTINPTGDLADSNPLPPEDSDESENSSDSETENPRGEMTTSAMKPPKELAISENMADVWKLWEQQFTWYSIASGLTSKTSDIRAATLMTCIGAEGIKLYNNFTFVPETEKENVTTILRKFRETFKSTFNKRYERRIFMKMQQHTGQSFDDFLLKLQTQVKKCDYHDDEDMVIDMIIAGIMSVPVKEKLLLEINLTFETALTLCRTAETTKIELKEFRNDVQNHTLEVDYIKQSRENQQEPYDCKRCGTKHGRRSCPAYMKLCEKCNMKGHLSKMCRVQQNAQIKHLPEKIVSEVVTEHPVPEYFMFEVSIEEKDDWFISIKCNGVNFNAKLDTGAQCNVLSLKMVKKLKAQNVKPAKGKIVSYTKHKLDIIGTIILNCKINAKMTSVTFFVVDGEVNTILGRKTCEEENLIMRMTNKNVQNLLKSEYKVSEVALQKQYSDLFVGMGVFKHFAYDIDLVPGSTFDNLPPRRIPLHIKDQVKKEIDDMVTMDIIESVTAPTPISSPMVIVKKNGKLRICMDPSKLNAAILRRNYPMKSVEEIAAEIEHSKYFTVLDCKKGFWQIPVTKRTQAYLTFSTPWGRYSYKKLPFGISSASEIYQQIMCSLLEGVPNTMCVIDDIIIHAETIEELRTITKTVLDKIREAGLRLNPDKCFFESQKVKFLGHIFSSEGLQIDNTKVDAIDRLKTPTNRLELERLLGMVNYLHKFIPNLSNLTAKIRELLSEKVDWLWTAEHDQCVQNIREVLKAAPVLKFFEVNKPITLTVDSSSKSIGGALLQNGQPVAYITKTLSPAQTRFSQIEKEATAIRRACQKFHSYIYGCTDLTIETDCKALETIFKRSVDEAPPRLQRIYFEILQYNPKVIFKEGKKIALADTLSRDCSIDANDVLEEDDYEINVIWCVNEQSKERVIKATKEDVELQNLLQTVNTGWPNQIQQCPESLKKYWNFRELIACIDDVMFKGDKIIVPESMKTYVLKQLHAGHIGITSMLQRARTSVYWTRMQEDIEQYVQNCAICKHHSHSNQKQPQINHEIPNLPWKFVASDMFHYGDDEYVLIVDAYSNFFTFKKLQDTKTKDVTDYLSEMFGLLGIPETLLSDNGPQYASGEFKKFAETWGIKHITSSPEYAQSNGLAERYVQVAKNLLKKCDMDGSNIHLALLNVRNVERPGLGSPSQRIFSRNTRTKLDFDSARLVPKIQEDVESNLQQIRNSQNQYANVGAKERKPLTVGDRVVIQAKNKKWYSGTVTEARDNRSYNVQQDKNSNIIRRNIRNLRKAGAVVITGANVTPANSNPAAQPANPVIQPRVSPAAQISSQNIVYQNNPVDVTAVAPQQILDNAPQQFSPVASQPMASAIAQRSRYGRLIKPVNKLNL